MVKILVTGANGYIGGAVAIELARRGHTVFGLIRKQADAAALEVHEVTAVIGDISDVKSFDETLQQVSVVIDTVHVYTDKPAYESNRKLLARFTELSRSSPQKRRFIYTSGGLVYGKHDTPFVDENTPTKGNQARAAFDQEVITSQGIEGSVLRPVFVYGGKGNHYIADWFGSNDKGEIVIKGNPNKVWGWIHIEDLAAAYAAVAEAPGGAVAGEIFDVADDSRVTVEQAKTAFARAAGVKGPVVHLPADSDPFSQLCEVSFAPTAKKIRQRLGWVPTRASVLDHQDQYYRAAVASGLIKPQAK